MIRRLWELERIYVLVMVFIALNIVTLAWSGISAYRQLAKAECQTAWNAHFLDVTRANQAAAAQYQTAVADALNTMGTILDKPRTPTSRAEMASALDGFRRSYATWQASRERYPALPNPACE